MRLMREIVVPLLVGLLVAWLQSAVPWAALTRLLIFGIIAAAIALTLVLILERRFNRSNTAVVPIAGQALQQPPTPEPPPRIFVPAHVTPKFLLDQRTDVTSIQAD